MKDYHRQSMRIIFNLILVLSFYSTTHTYAGILDSFKDPSELILNQRDCWLYSEYRNGQMINGKFIINEYRVLGEFTKLDKKRVTFKRFNFEPGETPPELLLNVAKEGKRINASLPINGRTILSCSL